MPNQAQSAQSPMVNVDLAIASEVLTIKEIPFLGHVNLRGAIDNTDFMAAAEKVLGGALPLESNTFFKHGDNCILWCGPDEWLILTQPDQQTVLVEAMRAAIGDTFAAVTDVSGGNTVLEISGSAAGDFIAKGTPLDLHPSVFSVGHCAQTVFAHAGMTIYLVDDEPTFRIVIRRSFSDYLATWILDAAQEFV